MTDKTGYWQSFDFFYFCGCANILLIVVSHIKHRTVINLKFTLIFDLEENLIIMYLKHKSTRTCPREGLLSVRWTQLTVGRWTWRAVAENWARESDHRWLNHFFVFHHFIKCVVWIERRHALCKCCVSVDQEQYGGTASTSQRHITTHGPAYVCHNIRRHCPQPVL